MLCAPLPPDFTCLIGEAPTIVSRLRRILFVEHSGNFFQVEAYTGGINIRTPVLDFVARLEWKIRHFYVPRGFAQTRAGRMAGWVVKFSRQTYGFVAVLCRWRARECLVIYLADGVQHPVGMFYFYFCVKVWICKNFKTYVEQIFQKRLKAVLLEVITISVCL